MSKSLIVAAGILAAGMTAAMAADMRMPMKAPPIVDPPFSWTGVYLGGNAGYSWGRARTDQTDTTSSTATTQLFRGSPPVGAPLTDGAQLGQPQLGAFPQVVTTSAGAGTAGRANINGVIGGGQAGYNWQLNRSWVLGLEADIQGSGERGSVTVCSVAGCTAGSLIGTANTRLDWFGTVRGRVGFLPIDKLMLYGTGGLAYGSIRSDYLTGVNGSPLIATSVQTTRVGYAVGAGAEGAIDRHWSVKGEYLYMDFGRFSGGSGTGAATTTVVDTPILNATATLRTTTVASTAAALSTRLTDHVFRIGVNYHF